MELGDRMKSYEGGFMTIIPPQEPFIVRLDGHSFSKFTRKLSQPFDKNFVKVMVKTMNDLVDKFNARTGYCHSDEISLIFDRVMPPINEITDGDDLQSDKPEIVNVHMYNGRVQKIVSLMAGYCSARFNFHASKIFGEHYGSGEHYFDGRVVVFMGEDIEIVNHMVWRSLRDCPRNCILKYANYILKNTEIYGKKCDELVKMMKEKNFDYETQVPPELKHGVYCKRELYLKKSKTLNEQDCIRKRLVNKSFVISANDYNKDLMLSKYWEDTPLENEYTIYSLE
jgi:tRNA(His) guanylyltransferase